MRLRALLILLLGLWLGGSLAVGAVASYNLAGLPQLFERNPRLGERAGFDPSDSAVKKQSLLWVHASELNRVFFETWNRCQLVLGVLALILTLGARATRVVLVLLALTLVLVAWTHLGVEPQVVELGRALDFVPRTPPPPQVEPFQRLHGLYFGAELIRLGLITLAAALLILKLPRESH